MEDLKDLKQAWRMKMRLVRRQAHRDRKSEELARCGAHVVTAIAHACGHQRTDWVVGAYVAVWSECDVLQAIATTSQQARLWRMVLPCLPSEHSVDAPSLNPLNPLNTLNPTNRANLMNSVRADQSDEQDHDEQDHVESKTSTVKESPEMPQEVETFAASTTRSAKRSTVTQMAATKVNGMLTWRWWQQGDTLVVPSFGPAIPQPSSTCAICPYDRIDALLIPVVAVDRWGVRLGNGGGYYDRVVPAINAQRRAKGLRDVVKIGVAYPQQVVASHLPCEAHDLRVEWIVTHEGVMNVGSDAVDAMAFRS